MSFKIGNVLIKNRIALAPMAGISNPAYMKIVEEMGCAYAVTELISAEAVVRGNKKTFSMLNGIDTLKMPVAIQIFGGKVESLVKAAKILTDMYPVSILDINMGCPVPKVAVRSEAGAALLKNPEKVREIVSSVVENVSVPVTVKIRSGWDQEHINAPLIAKICEEAGASAICIHGRTRSQGYTGKVDYDVIRSVKEAVSIPVFGNGDIVDIESCDRMFQTGVDAVMIGRGALGNPWIFQKLINHLEGKESFEVSNDEKIDVCLKHLEYLKTFQGERTAVLEIRSHVAWYLKGLPNSKEIREKIFLVHQTHDIIKLLNEYKLNLRKEG